jgi:hypothetical protein
LINSRNTVALWIAVTIGVLLIYHTCYDFRSLWPANVSWLMEARHDWGTHYLGWLFYKNEPWQFPLGQVSNYVYPIGTNVGFTDSIPLFALVFKIFSPVLPDDFQYFGLWLLSCHLLTAYSSILLLKRFGVKELNIFIAVMLIAANPVLVYRGLHPALCAHWLIIGSLYLYFSDLTRKPVRNILFFQWLLLVISALVNPYICFMILGFSFITSLKLSFVDKVSGKIAFMGYQVVSVVSLVFVWYLLGMFSFKGSQEFAVQGGYGLYSLNLNSLFNAWGYSSIFGTLKTVSWHQYEAYMYPGLGIFLLLIFSCFYYIFHARKESPVSRPKPSVWPRRKQTMPLIFLVLVYTLFAITNVISLNDNVLLTVPLPKFILTLGEIFRASGRFFWLPYYLLLFLTVIWIDRTRLTGWLQSLILFLGLMVQFYDTKPLLTSRKMNFGAYKVPLDQHWKSLISDAGQVVFYPPFEASYTKTLDYQDFCFLAGNARKPVNTGYVARLDSRAMGNYRDSLSKRIADGELAPNILYISDSAHLRIFSLAIQSSLVDVALLDNYFYFTARASSIEDKGSRPVMTDSSGYKAALKIIGQKSLFRAFALPDVPAAVKINFNIENIIDKGHAVAINGWAFIDSTTNNRSDSVFLVLSDEQHTYIAPAQRFLRPDLTGHFKKEFLDNAGFNSIIFKDSLAKGKYKLGVMIRDGNGKEFYQETTSLLQVGESIKDIVVPTKLGQLPPETNIDFGLDLYQDNADLLKIGGWAAFHNESYIKSVTKLVLTNQVASYSLPVEPVLRPDVTQSRSGKFNLDSSGFNVTVSKKMLPAGTYKLGIMIDDKKQNKKGIIYIDKSITTNSP